MSRTTLLIVHADPSIRALMASMLRSLGHRIEEADSDRAAIRLVEQVSPGLVLAGVDPLDPDALELLEYLRRKHPAIRAILLFPVPHADRMRDAMQRGAASVLRFPAPANSLRAAVSQALEDLGREDAPPPRPQAAPPPSPATSSTRADAAGDPRPSHVAGPRISALRAFSAVDAPGSPPSQRDLSPYSVVAVAGVDRNAEVGPASMPTLVGDDPAFRQMVELAASIAPSKAPVLIVGERGSGKSLIAKVLHAQSPRADGPFVEVACGVIGEEGLEAALVGRVGPGSTRLGLIAKADGGTLFLDEISAASPAVQERLLLLIRRGEYQPEGAARPISVDVRVVAATKVDLAAMVEESTFLSDLYHRISVVALKSPSLRSRGDDVLRLADHFRARFAQEIGKGVSGFTPEAAAAIAAYDWPGNVLELENAVERGVVLCRNGRIDPALLALPRHAASLQSADRAATAPSGRSTHGILPLKVALEAPERQLILQALEALNWNRQETARLLDINRTTLYKKMKKYGLLVEEPAWAG